MSVLSRNAKDIFFPLTEPKQKQNVSINLSMSPAKRLERADKPAAFKFCRVQQD